MPGSGKSEAAVILQQKGFRIIEMGNIVREMMKEQGIEITNESFRIFATQIREKLGNLVVANEIVKKLANVSNGEKVCIAGIRSTHEIECFKKGLGNVKVIAIAAPNESRYSRMKCRGRKDDPKSAEEFEFRDKKEIGWGIADAIRAADHIIPNAGSLEDLNKNIEKALNLSKVEV